MLSIWNRNKYLKVKYIYISEIEIKFPEIQKKMSARKTNLISVKEINVWNEIKHIEKKYVSERKTNLLKEK